MQGPAAAAFWQQASRQMTGNSAGAAMGQYSHAAAAMAGGAAAPGNMPHDAKMAEKIVTELQVSCLLSRVFDIR